MTSVSFHYTHDTTQDQFLGWVEQHLLYTQTVSATIAPGTSGLGFGWATVRGSTVTSSRDTPKPHTPPVIKVPLQGASPKPHPNFEQNVQDCSPATQHVHNLHWGL